MPAGLFFNSPEKIAITDLTFPFVLTLDIGTSSLRAMVFDSHARAVPGLETQSKYEMQTTLDGGVQADADELLGYANRAIDEVLASANGHRLPIAAVASDSLVSSILGVDAGGRAITPVYTYADTRPAREVDALRSRFDEETIHQRVGTLFHTSYLPSRFLWFARTHPDLMPRVRWWMSIGEYFYLRWLGRRACTYSVASWTGLLNRRKLEWDADLFTALPVSTDQLSPLVDVDTRLEGLQAEYAERWPKLAQVPWFPTVGDGATANIGSGCVDATRIALTIGTSSAMRVTAPIAPSSLRQAAIAQKDAEDSGIRQVPPGLWSYRVDRDNELVGGALSEGGNLYEWMRENLHLIDDPAELERQLDALPPDGQGLTVLPFLAGERAPGWVADARASILGLSLNTRAVDILRAGLEGVAYRLDLIFELLRAVAPEASEVIASGGALMHSPVWTQIIADVLGVPVIASAEPEATSRGTAVLALRSLGVINTLKDMPAARGTAYEPNAARHQVYNAAVKRQQKWYNLVVKSRGAAA